MKTKENRAFKKAEEIIGYELIKKDIIEGIDQNEPLDRITNPTMLKHMLLHSRFKGR